MRNTAFRNLFFGLAECGPAMLVFMLLGLSQPLAQAAEEGSPLNPKATSQPIETTKPTASRVDLLRALTKTESLSAEGAAADELLDPDDAFIPSLTVPDPNTLIARWTIAEGYYLYKNRLQISLVDAEGVNITDIDVPPGEPKEDEYSGLQEVFYNQVTLTAQLRRSQPEHRDIGVKLDYQGCAEIGVCYPPQTEIMPVILPIPPATEAAEAVPATIPAKPVSAGPRAPQAEQDRIATLLAEQRFLAMPAFFGFGILLAFTPCIFPMIPILSSIIVGQGEDITKHKAFMLSLTYVLAMAIAYTVAGVLAALLAQNIQAMFQNPWIISTFAGLFVLLALSMFGFYELQMPTSWQSKLTEISNTQSGSSYAGVAIMGLLSALIVGPCVAPPLIGVLAVIAATGDVMLGGSALFSMSLGMGTPLLIIGSAGGHLLPKAGRWMDSVKAVFGVLLLGMAIWMLDRVLPTSIGMFLWATLLIITAIYMGTLQPVRQDASRWQPMVRGLGMVMLIYGILLLVGVASGGGDALRPLKGLTIAANQTAKPVPEKTKFRHVETLAELEQEIKQTSQPVIVDFTADWCVSCKEMEEFTLSDPAVRTAMSKAMLLKADITENDAADKELLRHFELFGPPAILFFGPNGQERSAYRIVGFVSAEEFKAHLDQALQP